MSEYTVQRFLKGYAIVWHQDGKRHRSRLDAKDRAGAEAEARARWKAGTSDDAGTVGDIMGGYITSLERDQKPSAPRRRDAWKAMKAFWERTDPALIDAEMCRTYADQRKAAPATIRYELLMVSTALGWAKKPKPEMWLPPVAERKVRHLTHAQFETFFESVRAPHARLYVLLGLYTMARPTAILELTWDRIDFDRSQIDLNPTGRRQTAKRRPVVTMNDELRAELLKAYEARQIAHVIESGGKPVANIKKAFQAASERCGITVTPYMLRHTGAVWAAEAGTSMAALAQFMGHDDDSTTQKHYARFSPGYLKGVANAVQRRPI